jgi:hypothetical protein
VPGSIYAGALISCSAVAAFATPKLAKREVASLSCNFGNWRDNAHSYHIPVVNMMISYGLAWSIGFGGAFVSETIAEWSVELGLSDRPALGAIVIVTLFETV